MVMWFWSEDTLFWQLTNIDHNMGVNYRLQAPVARKWDILHCFPCSAERQTGRQMYGHMTDKISPEDA